MASSYSTTDDESDMDDIVTSYSRPERQLDFSEDNFYNLIDELNVLEDVRADLEAKVKHLQELNDSKEATIFSLRSELVNSFESKKLTLLTKNGTYVFLADTECQTDNASFESVATCTSNASQKEAEPSITTETPQDSTDNWSVAKPKSKKKKKKCKKSNSTIDATTNDPAQTSKGAEPDPTPKQTLNITLEDMSTPMDSNPTPNTAQSIGAATVSTLNKNQDTKTEKIEKLLTPISQPYVTEPVDTISAPAPRENKSKKPPPIIVHPTEPWTLIRSKLKEAGINNIEAKCNKTGMKLTVENTEKFKTAKQILQSHQIQFHTFARYLLIKSKDF